jgi:hypothetical protein
MATYHRSMGVRGGSTRPYPDPYGTESDEEAVVAGRERARAYATESDDDEAAPLAKKAPPTTLRPSSPPHHLHPGVYAETLFSHPHNNDPVASSFSNGPRLDDGLSFTHKRPSDDWTAPFAKYRREENDPYSARLPLRFSEASLHPPNGSATPFRLPPMMLPASSPFHASDVAPPFSQVYERARMEAQLRALHANHYGAAPNGLYGSLSNATPFPLPPNHNDMLAASSPFNGASVAPRAFNTDERAQADASSRTLHAHYGAASSSSATQTPGSHHTKKTRPPPSHAHLDVDLLPDQVIMDFLSGIPEHEIPRFLANERAKVYARLKQVKDFLKMYTLPPGRRDELTAERDALLGFDDRLSKLQFRFWKPLDSTYRPPVFNGSAPIPIPDALLTCPVESMYRKPDKCVAISWKTQKEALASARAVQERLFFLKEMQAVAKNSSPRVSNALRGWGHELEALYVTYEKLEKEVRDTYGEAVWDKIHQRATAHMDVESWTQAPLSIPWFTRSYKNSHIVRKPTPSAQVGELRDSLSGR